MDKTSYEEGEAPRFPLTGAWLCRTFSPWLMPWLYGLAWMVMQKHEPAAAPGCEQRVEAALEPYASSLYPLLAKALQGRDEGPQPILELGAASEMDPESLPLENESVGSYYLHGRVHRYRDRRALLEEAYRVLQPGGLLQLSDMTPRWVESIWTVRLAAVLGLKRLRRQLIRAKLLDTETAQLSEPEGWRQILTADRWEVVELRPYLASSTLTLSSVFESLNFKQGGPSPIWIEGKLRRLPWLAALYRGLLRRLGKALVERDESLSQAEGGAFVLVTARKRGERVTLPPHLKWREGPPRLKPAREPEAEPQVASCRQAGGSGIYRWRALPLSLVALLAIGLGQPTPSSLAWGSLLSILAETLRFWAIGFTGGPTRGVVLEAPKLVSAGPYAYVRNPLYVGNLLNGMAMAVAATGGLPAWQAMGVVVLCGGLLWRFYGMVIGLEEAFLERSFGQSYRDYCRAVPRLMPRPSPAGPQEGSFSLDRALFFEKSTLFWVVLVWLLVFLRH